MSDLVNMVKDGVVTGVHNTCVEAHERQGWAVTEQEVNVVEAAEKPEKPKKIELTDEEKEVLDKARADYKDLTDKKLTTRGMPKRSTQSLPN